MFGSKDAIRIVPYFVLPQFSPLYLIRICFQQCRQCLILLRPDCHHINAASLGQRYASQFPASLNRLFRQQTVAPSQFHITEFCSDILHDFNGSGILSQHLQRIQRMLKHRRTLALFDQNTRFIPEIFPDGLFFLSRQRFGRIDQGTFPIKQLFL